MGTQGHEIYEDPDPVLDAAIAIMLADRAGGSMHPEIEGRH